MDDRAIVDLLWRAHPDLGNETWTAYDYCFAAGASLDAWMYLGLFWPRAVEIADMVFMPDFATLDVNEGTICAELDRFKGSKSAVERSFNSVEITNLIGGWHIHGEPLLDALTARLVDVWTARLRHAFPDRPIRVELSEPGEAGDQCLVGWTDRSIA